MIHPSAVLGFQPMQSKALARKPGSTEGFTIGEGTVIGPFAVIYAGVRIGRDCLIGDHASIREGSVIGNRCIIGRAVTVNYDAHIADEVRIMDGSHITGGMKIGRGSFIGVGVITSNDRTIDPTDYTYRGSKGPVVGEYVMIGSGANILAGITIGDHAVIGAGALVTRDVPSHARVMGQRAKER